MQIDKDVEGKIRAYIKRRFASYPNDLEDFQQEALLKVLSLDSSQMPAMCRSSQVGYLCSVAGYAVLTYMRDRQGWKRHELNTSEDPADWLISDNGEGNPANHIGGFVDGPIILRELQHIQPVRREVVLLTASGLSDMQIAEWQHVTRLTVRSRLCKARKAIKEHLATETASPGE
jgi:RNA polymerase sigma factor (sigma-70 family)